MASTLFTAALIIGAIIILTAIFNWLHKQRQQKKIAIQKTFFENIVAKHNLRISEKEEINSYLFAIDKAGYRLLHLNFGKPEEETTVIDLQKIKAVKLDTEETSIYEIKKGKSVLSEKHITKLQLAVNFKDPNQPQKLLALYQYQDGMQNLISTKRRGEHWQDVINKCIKQLPGAPA
jgi:hypothetical protein